MKPLIRYVVKRMARPRTRDHDELRESLVDVGGRILAAEGPQALNLRRVAQDAGTSTAAVYRLFEGKQGLVLAMFLDGFARLDRAFDAVPTTDDPVADLIELGRAYRASARANPHLYALMFGRPVPEFVPGDATVQSTLRSLGKLADTVARCVEAGHFPPVDPARVARQLHGLVHGLASLELLRCLGDEQEARAQWEQALRAATRGYATPAP